MHFALRRPASGASNWPWPWRGHVLLSIRGRKGPRGDLAGPWQGHKGRPCAGLAKRRPIPPGGTGVSPARPIRLAAALVRPPQYAQPTANTHLLSWTSGNWSTALREGGRIWVVLFTALGNAGCGHRKCPPKAADDAVSCSGREVAEATHGRLATGPRGRDVRTFSQAPSKNRLLEAATQGKFDREIPHPQAATECAFSDCTSLGHQAESARRQQDDSAGTRGSVTAVSKHLEGPDTQTH